MWGFFISIYLLYCPAKPSAMSCKCCFEDFICHCVPYDDVITINTALIPGQALSWVITDKFENEYQGDITVEDDGTVDIPIAALPDGLLNQFAGSFKIQLFDGCKAIPFPLAQNYDCIVIDVKGGSREKNTIGCPMGAAGAGVQNGIVEFTNTDELTIDWSQFINNFGNFPVIQVYQKDDFDPNIYNLIQVQITQTRNAITGILQSIFLQFTEPIDGYVLITG